MTSVGVIICIIIIVILVLIIIGIAFGAWYYVKNHTNQECQDNTECPKCPECPECPPIPSNCLPNVSGPVSLLLLPNVYSSPIFMGLCDNSGTTIPNLNSTNTPASAWTVDGDIATTFFLKGSNGKYVGYSGDTVTCQAADTSTATPLTLTPTMMPGVYLIGLGSSKYIGNRPGVVICDSVGSNKLILSVTTSSAASGFLFFPRT